MNLDYHELYKSESGGAYGAFGIQILAACHLPHEQGEPEPPVDWDHETIRHAMYDVAKIIQGAVMKVQIAKLPAAQARAKAEREQLIGCFPQPIHVKEIPNGYCSDYCCAHLPWFIVTTTVGPIKIGWRKRVINIDWSETEGTLPAEELFKSENTTKSGRSIHAWSVEKAKGYVDAILAGKPINHVTTVPT